MSRKLVAALACRSTGSRLYGKPLQNLDIERGITVLQYMIDWVKTIPQISDIVLGISEGLDNLTYITVAKENGIHYILGDEQDVLGRLIQCADRCQGTDIFRLTTESPFTYFEAIERGWRDHVDGNYDLSTIDDLPDGSGFEIIKVDAYRRSHENGEDRHRSELCSLYIRENKDQFSIKYIELPKFIKRTDIRLTIDYPEDLILCRAVYNRFRHLAPRIPVGEIISFLDANPKLKALVEPFIEEGLKTMYL
ncbi:MAG: acylneuraminate cytidylyltransferase [Desulfobacteraceae bacterium]|nr:MAG: acylneuraminate cytidylyltransferase [Desulfobacteraceae bacterium]